MTSLTDGLSSIAPHLTIRFFLLLLLSSDGLMTLADFAALCRTLFRNEQGKAYAIEESRIQEMFDVFDQNQVNSFNQTWIASYSILYSPNRMVTLTLKSLPFAGNNGLNR